MNFETAGIYFIYTLIYIFFAVVLKLVLNFRAAKHYNTDDMIRGGNIAVGLRRGGAQLGLAIAMMGVMASGSAETLVNDLTSSAIYGLLATVFIVSSLVVTDKLVLPKIENMQALKDNNIAVGMIEFGMLVATGIIAYSSILGDGGGIVSSIAYFVGGQLTLVALILAYELLAHRKANLLSMVKDNNLACGVYLAGKLIAYALILKSAIVGNVAEATTIELVTNYLSLAIVGMIFLYLFEYIIDWVIVTSTRVTNILQEDLIVPVIQLTASKIGVALLLSIAIL
jgi:uncharacterized membrane protein YjfL (UPF0719 family)